MAEEAEMNDLERKREEAYLAGAVGCIDAERGEIDERLRAGVEAADAQSSEFITQQFLRRLKVLILIKDKPYFARVDFKPQNEAAERLYLGKTSVVNEKGGSVVVDWRAPISTLYYEGRVGRAAYTCPDGTVEGEITLKRQFEIEDRRLLGYNDIDITFDEELLKPYLSVSSNTRLKNIIATIQAEQNRIIRAGLLKPLIVQGVAGSGKTTVALHRIAYLIYAANIPPEQFLIIAPNALFLDYISGVLPDLGVENVNQKTYDAFAQEFLGKKLRVEDPGEKLGRILGGENAELETAASEFKSSLRFRGAVQAYLADVERELLPRENFCVGRFSVCGYEQLLQMFTKDFAASPMKTRLEFIKKRLADLISDSAHRAVAEIDADRRRRISALPGGLPPEEAKARRRQIYERDEGAVHDFLSGGKDALKSYFKKISLPSALECYARLLTEKGLLAKYAGGEREDVLAFVSARARKSAKGAVEYEDLAALICIQNRVCGAKQHFSIRHVVIDEAQDLSEFQLLALKEALGCGSMTVLGDVAQGIYAYRGTSDWHALAEKVFGPSCDFAMLKKSYRSTVEIMEQANRVVAKAGGLSEDHLAEPVIRSGEPVRYRRMGSKGEIAAEIARRIGELQAQGHRNIAVVCKTARECAGFAALLKKHLPDFSALEGKAYSGGVSVVSASLVKGLEFDAVLIADAHLYRENDLETKLLYVTMTRAMHVMDLYAAGRFPYELDVPENPPRPDTKLP